MPPLRMTRNVVIATKAFPLGGKVARYAPDEGEMSGSRKFPPHQLPAVTASPKGGKPYRRFTRNVHVAAKPRAGHTPPLPRDDFLLPRRVG